MSRTTTYAYDLSGNLVTKAMPNGVAEQRTHDGRNRVGTLQNLPVGGGSSCLSAYGYGYDAAGNVMQVAETYPGGSLANRTITNMYDGVYRLVQEEIVTTGAATVTTSYTYDKGNNRISKGVTGGGDDFGGTTYVIGNGSNGAGANQIKSATLPDATVVAFTYDANGNRTQRTEGGNTDTYSYDYENRLVGLDYETGESGTGTYGYSYDYRTRRVSRTEPVAGTTQIVFNGGTSIEEYSTGGPSSPVVEYVRGHDYGGGVGGLEYSVRSSTASFNQYDSRGDVTGQTDSSGTVTYQAAYKAFGKHPTESGSTQDRQKANTKEEDPTGLLNEGFRYRDLETGTFITRDPIGFKGGPNMYTYVRQNPWSKFDPEGLQDAQVETPKQVFPNSCVAATTKEAVRRITGTGVKEADVRRAIEQSEVDSGEYLPGSVHNWIKYGSWSKDAIPYLQKNGIAVTPITVFQIADMLNAGNLVMVALKNPRATGPEHVFDLPTFHQVLAISYTVVKKNNIDQNVYTVWDPGTNNTRTITDADVLTGNERSKPLALKKAPIPSANSSLVPSNDPATDSFRKQFQPRMTPPPMPATAATPSTHAPPSKPVQ